MTVPGTDAARSINVCQLALAIPLCW